jgi:hypothetical protein
MKTLKTMQVLPLVGLILVGCGKDRGTDSNTMKEAQEIIPLAVGNKWWLTFTEYDSTGSILQSAKWTRSIVGDTIINSYNWFLLQHEYSNLGSLAYEYLSNQDSGLYVRYTNGDGPYLWYPYPAAVGDSVTIFGLTIVSIDTLVSVPAGTRSCYCYGITMPSATDTLWEYAHVSPGWGFVADHSYVRRNGGIRYLWQSVVLDSLHLVD